MHRRPSPNRASPKSVWRRRPRPTQKFRSKIETPGRPEERHRKAIKCLRVQEPPVLRWVKEQVTGKCGRPNLQHEQPLELHNDVKSDSYAPRRIGSDRQIDAGPS